MGSGESQLIPNSYMCRYPLLAQIIGTLSPDTYHYHLCGFATEISYRLDSSQCYCFFLCSYISKKEGFYGSYLPHMLWS